MPAAFEANVTRCFFFSLSYEFFSFPPTPFLLQIATNLVWRRRRRFLVSYSPLPPLNSPPSFKPKPSYNLNKK